MRAGVGRRSSCPSRSPRTGPCRSRSAAGGSGSTIIASLTSLASIFLPRYSGVRPTISPARNTATMTYISMFRNPAPMPLKSTLSIISDIGTSPPSGLKLSCMQLTEPLDVAVVIAAQVAEATGPSRTSLPSMLPPWRTGRPAVAALGWSSARIATADADQEQSQHHAVDHRGVRAVLDHQAEHDDRGHRDDDDRDDLEEVAPGARVLERMCRVRARRSRRRWCRAA